MLFTRPLVLAASLALAVPAAFAQQRIEQQMTPEQLEATGLGKLTPEELANLNAWLDGKLEAETAKAAESAKRQAADENRGLLAAPASREPIVGRLSGEFRGFGKGRSYALDNGQVWKQTDDASLAGVRLDAPAVRIAPSLIGGAWYMSVEGYNTRAKVERVK
ncbi:hypothetical protein [Vulcaniibacterium tengchongense]|uniref:Secreted protein n=1 Tax=Vulcaniibacterium tengchongense TaxID=1273429 RepID=A0A3N4V6W5_9GAMM|nr:hypothetical protein [Vulcaniibacterium tengchongense]RPE75439.1 hypothetical protein EDC50_2884 [Vulcaniibacterium tengchongense]